MFEAGRVPRYYLLRDEAERANALQMDAMARSRAEQALIALKTTLGIDLSSPITLADQLQYTPATVSIEDGVRGRARRIPTSGRRSSSEEAPRPRCAPARQPLPQVR
jgi:outer membrane protein TolC